MHPNVRAGHETIWTKFFNEKTQQLYDAEVVDPCQFPTLQEVAQCIPRANAPCPVNDPNLQGGWILAANVHAHALTGDDDYAAKARRLFEGLLDLADLARTPGYIPRGSVPGHGIVYPNSSVDQYTGFFYGMWRYCTSPIATGAEKGRATGRILDAARLIESHGHNVPCDDGLPSFYGDIGAIDEPGRCCRLLQTYRTAFLMSGDDHWERLYREKLAEQDRARLRTYFHSADYPPERPIANWGLWQNQAAFRMLFETEDDPAVKGAYKAALDDEARIALPRLAGWREVADAPERPVIPDLWRVFWAEFAKQHPDHDRRTTERPYHHHVFAQFMRDNADRIEPTKAMRDRATVAQGCPGYHLQMLAVAMAADDPELLRDAAREGLPMLTEAKLTQPDACGALKAFELAYWRGVELELYPAG